MAESGEACVTSLTGDVLLYQEDSEDMMKIKGGPDQTVCRVAPTQKDKLYIYAHDGWVCMNRMGAFSDDVCGKATRKAQFNRRRHPSEVQ